MCSSMCSPVCASVRLVRAFLVHAHGCARHIDEAIDAGARKGDEAPERMLVQIRP